MKSLRNSLAKFRKNLVRFNEHEPLGKLSLAIIILLDMFILSILFGGLADHTAQLTSPSEYFPYECRQVFIHTSWSETNKISELQKILLRDYNDYSYRYNKTLDKTEIDKMHPVCRNFYRLIKSVYEKNELKELFVKRQNFLKKYRQTKKKFSQSDEVYKTSLLEKIADEKNSTLTAVANSVKSQSAKLNQIQAEITDLDRQINKNPLIIELSEMIKPDDKSFRQNLIDDINRYERIYLFREFAWQMLFLAPLFLLFAFWYKRSAGRENKIQTLVSSHLLVVASIPVVMKLIELVLDLIPNYFFRELFRILKMFHIVALWHYVLIFGSVGVAMFFIYFIQKKIFNQTRVYRKRLMKNRCYRCDRKLPKQDGICPFCGSNQMRKCGHCGAQTYVAGEYCIVCEKK